jgi:hypothetical protein
VFGEITWSDENHHVRSPVVVKKMAVAAYGWRTVTRRMDLAVEGQRVEIYTSPWSPNPSSNSRSMSWMLSNIYLVLFIKGRIIFSV